MSVPDLWGFAGRFVAALRAGEADAALERQAWAYLLSSERDSFVACLEAAVAQMAFAPYERVEVVNRLNRFINETKRKDGGNTA